MLFQHKTKPRLVTLVASVIILFCIGLLLRHIYNSPDLADEYNADGYPWVTKHVVLNSAGYRDREHTIAKPSDTFRIYTLGDSFTYGWLINNPDEVYPRIIEHELPSKVHKPIEVINAGVPGNDLEDEVRRFQWEGTRYNPDLVVIGLNYDDLAHKLYRPADAFLPKFLTSSYVYQFLIGQRLIDIADHQTWENYKSVYSDENSMEWKRSSEELLSLKHEVEKRHGRLALLLFPHINTKKPNAPYDFYAFHNRLRSFGAKNNIMIIDPLKDILRIKDKGTLIQSLLDEHPTVLMNKLVAKNILNNKKFIEFIKQTSPYMPKVSTGDIATVPSDALITSLTDKSGQHWFIMDDPNHEYKEIPPPDMSSQAAPTFPDKIRIRKDQVGVELLHYVYSQTGSNVRIPDTMYGYPVIGFTSFEGQLSNGITTPFKANTIIKEGREFVISYDKAEYRILKIGLLLLANKFVVEDDIQHSHALQADIVRGINQEETNTVSFTLDKPIVSSLHDKGSFAFVNNVITLMKVDQYNQNITLKFDNPLPVNSSIIFPINLEKALSPSELTATYSH